MTFNTEQVTNFLEEKNPSIATLKKYPKDVILRAYLKILENNKTYELSVLQGNQSMLDKQIELEKLKLDRDRLQAAKEISEDIFTRAQEKMTELRDVQYAPTSIARVTEATAKIYKDSLGGLASKSDDPEKSEDDDLEERVELAQKQGMKWNSSNIQPTRRSTVVRKVEIWERAYGRGKDTDIDSVISLEYEDVLRAGDSEAYVVGICESIENYLGIGPSSQYLKTRFKRDVARYAKVKGLSIKKVEDGKPVIDNEAVYNELIDRFMGPGIDSNKREHCLKMVRRYVEWANGKWNEVDIDMFRKMVSGHKPVGLVYNTVNGVEPSVPEVFQAVVVKKLYDDQLKEFWDKFCEEKGLVAAR